MANRPVQPTRAADRRVVRFAANLPRDARQHIHLFNLEVRRISHNLLIHQTKAGDQPVIMLALEKVGMDLLDRSKDRR